MSHSQSPGALPNAKVEAAKEVEAVEEVENVEEVEIVKEVGIVKEVVVKTEKKNAKMYKALKHGKENEVLERCKEMDGGALSVLTIHGDTVLHVAVYTRQADLTLKLLEQIKKEDGQKLVSCVNKAGNTILHEAAAFNSFYIAAKKMLKLAPKLLTTRNYSNETPLFRAAGYGKIFMFSLLDRKAIRERKDVEEHKYTFYRNGQTTILHMAIISGKFDMALIIAMRCKFLIDEKDSNGMTALQHLARNSSAFKEKGILRRLVLKCVARANPAPDADDVDRGWKVPLLDAICEESRQFDLALELAKLLIKSDMSWRETNTMDGPPSTSPETIPKTPLFLATKTGCKAIVKMILKRYPQAIEHVDENGSAILHIAIKHRHLEILDWVVKMGPSISKLIKKCDNKGNSILHVVAYDLRSAEKRQEHSPEHQAGKMEQEKGREHNPEDQVGKKEPRPYRSKDYTC